MPHVNVQITDDGATPEQRAALVAEITDSRVPGEKPKHVHVVLDLVDPENRGYKGVLTTERRARP